MRKQNLIFLMFIALCCLVSCIADDDGKETPDFPEPNKGTIQANRLKLTYYPKSNPAQRSTFEYYDPDGSGGNPPTINETITLDLPSGSFEFYESEIEIMNDNDTVTDEIEVLGTQYIVCYRNLDPEYLRKLESNKDSEGVDLGTESDWTTVSASSSGGGTMLITLNFQNADKQGVCDDGFRILEANMNYRLQ